jgi:hypothetical protein
MEYPIHFKPEGWTVVCAQLSWLSNDMADNLPNVKGTDRQKVYCYSLFTRARTNFEGALMMLQHGMLMESLTLARSCIESAIFLGALKSDILLIKDLEMDQTTSEIGLIHASLALYKSLDRGSLEAAKMSAQLAELAKQDKKRIKVDDLANRINRVELYAIYKHLSATAAHPSMSTIVQGYSFGEGKNINLGIKPENITNDEINSVMFYCCIALLTACCDLNEVADLYYSSQKIDAIFEHCQKLMSKN